MRRYRSTFRLLGVFLGDPERWWTGLELKAEARMWPGTLYPVLDRLETNGWIEARWDGDAYPRRRLYRWAG